jgi:glutamine amidotransferase
MITIIDYGLGNISAFSTVYERLNIPVAIATTKEQLRGASKLILPGVGAFDYTMSMLNNSGMRDSIEALVLEQGMPIMGVCVGMQILAERSEEGVLPGLGWIKGAVRLFDTTHLKFKTKLPHMGWNTIQPSPESRLLNSFNEDSRFYFLHSYYVEPEFDATISAKSEYGFSFASAIQKDNIYGIQFHPEKSLSNGMQLLKNFAEL